MELMLERLAKDQVNPRLPGSMARPASRPRFPALPDPARSPRRRPLRPALVPGASARRRWGREWHAHFDLLSEGGRRRRPAGPGALARVPSRSWKGCCRRPRTSATPLSSWLPTARAASALTCAARQGAALRLTLLPGRTARRFHRHEPALGAARSLRLCCITEYGARGLEPRPPAQPAWVAEGSRAVRRLGAAGADAGSACRGPDHLALPAPARAAADRRKAATRRLHVGISTCARTPQRALLRPVVLLAHYLVLGRAADARRSASTSRDRAGEEAVPPFRTRSARSRLAHASGAGDLDAACASVARVPVPRMPTGMLPR